MIQVFATIGTALVTATLFSVLTLKMLGAMQQSGYKTQSFMRWLRRSDNVFFNRLFVLSLILAVSSATTAIAFSFLGQTWANILSAIPFFAFLVLFIFVDSKYALKVPLKATGRLIRLFVVYLVLIGGANYGLITLLGYLAKLNGSLIYGYIAYMPFSLMPMLLPVFLLLAHFICSPFENARNNRYVARAKQTLKNSDKVCIGIVGSYGKTSVKNILKEILAVKYSVLETPASYNTPMGIAHTINMADFSNKEIFIAEMGARKVGDIAQLCDMLQPKYAIFTGVCAQHIASFKDEETIFAEKSKIIDSGAFTVCGASIKEQVQAKFGETRENVRFADTNAVSHIEWNATGTKCKIRLGENEIAVDTPLLGGAAVENILLAATLAFEMGLTCEEIEKGIANVQAIPHRLQLIEANGVYILDDGYNCNPRGAEEALAALSRFAGKKYVVTPGIVECGVMEETINSKLGEKIASYAFDGVVLVGDALVCAVKGGYTDNGGDVEKLTTVKTLDEAKTYLAENLQSGDAVLFLNDLPDVY